jgi:hypothetical protein
MTMSLTNEHPLRLGILADTASERDYLPVANDMKNKLLLADADYVGLTYSKM